MVFHIACDIFVIRYRLTIKSCRSALIMFENESISNFINYLHEFHQREPCPGLCSSNIKQHIGVVIRNQIICKWLVTWVFGLLGEKFINLDKHVKRRLHTRSATPVQTMLNYVGNNCMDMIKVSKFTTIQFFGLLQRRHNYNRIVKLLCMWPLCFMLEAGVARWQEA